MFTDEEQKHLKNYINNIKVSLGGQFLFYLIPFRKKVVLQNMQKVFGDILSNSEILILAKGFYSHVASSLKENLLLRLMSLKQIQSRAIIKGENYLWELVDNKIKGAILITGHFGNWEFAPIAGMLKMPKWQNRFYVVRKYIGTKWIEKILFRRYYQAGLNVIPKKNALNNVMDALEAHNAVAFIMDQHASLKAKDGIAVDFFGSKAGTFRSPAMIASYTGVPVLGFRTYRQKDGKHILEFFPQMPWIKASSPKEELAANTRQYNQFIEKLILEYPDQWLWMHKRWKNT